MGAWSEDNFGNDSASDWIWELEKSKGVNTLLSPIQSVLNENEYLEVDICSEALAASEVIAAAITNDHTLLPDEARNWLNRKQGWLIGRKPQVTAGHAKQALRAVQKVLSNSELQELWEEDGVNEKWRAIQNNLIAKLENA
ncbi:DUF4259 domain-containing protein [Vibrio parahaemolyticus]|uniref:DUF4259 domain-containing protein n=1 Tax=Vibrio parahaemolyticus TaxID=670 RepID=UPI00040B663C|nr:DUF4259 domain-containing protein [Vibrio parahaemolyticus]EIF8963215.1 DUF4259 domain-containing protein [Vibrio parahaemolyticus]EIO4088605.1 DUF4259 domain-containing protein [Vibrio parahaemolyticus]TOL13553.1 DUF4259 domain-containing protein [Vibrio parahaemolyticus]TOL55065.1 DUF4259 domain-containing protein [Vibrio parahaemolyticus]TOL84901.1 DUF4259 domain-containing protein [Vibrio parahaemolyticus]